MRLENYLKETTTTTDVEKNLAKGYVDLIGMRYKKKKKKSELTGMEITIHEELNEKDIKLGILHVIKRFFSKSKEIRKNEIWLKIEEIASNKIKKATFEKILDQLVQDGLLIRKSSNIFMLV